MIVKTILPFPCNFCGKLLTDWCQNCIEFYEGKQDVKPKDPDDMTYIECLTEIHKLVRRMSVPVDIVMPRLNKLQDRISDIERTPLMKNGD